MTVKELSILVKSQIEVKSGYNGKVLCRNYSEKKHSHISDREVILIWSEIRVTSGYGYGNTATPIVCVYVHGEKEYNDTPTRRPTMDYADKLDMMDDDCNIQGFHLEDTKSKHDGVKEIKKQARWKGAGMGDYTCSLCDAVVAGTPDYCPFCHSYMK